MRSNVNLMTCGARTALLRGKMLLTLVNYTEISFENSFFPQGEEKRKKGSGNFTVAIQNFAPTNVSMLGPRRYMEEERIHCGCT